jgi:hypothetical protein
MSVSTLYIIDDRMVNEYGAAGGMRAGRRKVSIRRNCVPHSLYRSGHRKSHMT